MIESTFTTDTYDETSAEFEARIVGVVQRRVDKIRAAKAARILAEKLEATKGPPVWALRD